MKNKLKIFLCAVAMTMLLVITGSSENPELAFEYIVVKLDRRINMDDIGMGADVNVAFNFLDAKMKVTDKDIGKHLVTLCYSYYKPSTGGRCDIGLRTNPPSRMIIRVYGTDTRGDYYLDVPGKVVGLSDYEPEICEFVFPVFV